MTIKIRNPKLEALIRHRLQSGEFASIEEMLMESLTAGTPDANVAGTAPQEAVRLMTQFSERHRLSLDEPVSRKLAHEGHRY